VPRKKLDELPGKENKFWKHAEYITIVPKEKKKCKHFFIYRRANEVECQHCHIGYFLSPGWEVKEGHIYKGSKLVI